MRCVWIRTGPDGHSHFEDLEIPLLADAPDGPAAAVSSWRSDPLPAGTVNFMETSGSRVADFHPAPRRQFVVVLSGFMEIECGDGNRRQFGPGEILLADDTSGKGHITRDVGAPRRTITVTLPDGFDPASWRI